MVAAGLGCQRTAQWQNLAIPSLPFSKQTSSTLQQTRCATASLLTFGSQCSLPSIQALLHPSNSHPKDVLCSPKLQTCMEIMTRRILRLRMDRARACEAASQKTGAHSAAITDQVLFLDFSLFISLCQSFLLFNLFKKQASCSSMYKDSKMTKMSYWQLYANIM